MGIGIGNASLGANMLHNLMDMREYILYEIFSDLNKTYNSLDCGFCLNILVAYIVGPRALHPLRRYGDRLTMVARSGGYFGTL